MDDEPEFVLTRFINPHLMWIRSLKPSDEFTNFEEQFNRQYKNNKNLDNDVCKPKIGDMVAYFDRAIKKWYRAVVDLIIEVPNVYYLWLVDYGYSIKVSANSVNTLERKFRTPETFGNVLQVGVANILPATEDYDFLNEQPVIEMANCWKESTIMQLQKIFDMSYAVEFQEKLRIGEKIFGDLTIHTNTGKVLNLRKVLTKSPNAVEVKPDEFTENMERINTVNIDRYLDNNRQCIKTPERKGKLPKKVSPVPLVAKPKIVSDKEIDEMPPLVAFEESHVAVKSDAESQMDEYESSLTNSDKMTPNSKKNAMDRLRQMRAKKLNDDEQSNHSSSSSSSTIMPSCYDQILAQEDRIKKLKPRKPGLSRLDKMLAKRNALTNKLEEKKVNKEQKTPDNSAKSSPDDKISRMHKSLSPTTDLGLNDQLKSRQYLKYRTTDDDDFYRSIVDFPLVMVHGKHPARAVYNYNEVPFTPEVFEAIKKRTPRNEIRRLQAHVWPHIMHEDSAVLIGKPGSGKTSTLIPAICSLVIRLHEDEQIPESSGPAVIIVAAFADNVSEICCNIRFHLRKWNERQEEDKKILVEEAYGMHRKEEVEASLLNGVGVLVVTPPCLQRMIERSKEVPLFRKSRVKIMVVEDFDVVHNNFGQILCDQIQYFSVKHKDGNPTQLMITSSQWEPQLMKYCTFGKNPALYIAHYIEAAVYGRVHFRLNFAKKDTKKVLLQHFLADDIYKAKRTMVICSDDEEVDEVCNFLRNLHITFTSYTHDTEEAGREQALSWHEDSTRHLSVLVCSDNVLGDLTKVKNVQRLFHFSLPDLWSTFSFRFSVFFNSYCDFVSKKGEMPQGYEPPFAQIVIDENARNTLPRLTEFLERVNAKIPKEVLEISRQILIARDASRKSLDLCPYFLEYGLETGKCARINCRDRHNLLPCDKPTSRMPPHGAFLKVNVTCIHSPIHFSAQVLAYRFRNEREWSHFDNKDQNAADVELNLQLNLYFNNYENQRQQSNVKKGDLCGWFEAGSTYRRVLITENPKKHPSIDKPQKVNIRLIDTGDVYYDQAVTSLFELPDALKKIPPRAIDIHHTGFVPYDGDKYWGNRAKKCIDYTFNNFEKKMKADKNNAKNYYVRVSVNFRLENHIFTPKVTLCEPLEGENYVEYPLHKILMRSNFAQKDKEAKNIKILSEMAENLGFRNDEDLGYSSANTSTPFSDTCDNSKNDFDISKASPRSTWDYLDRSTLHQIVVYHMENSSQFSIVRIDRLKKIDELHDFINKCMSDPKNVRKIKNPEPGSNCLVPMDEDYVRGRIIDVKNDVASIFICDFGRLENYDLNEIFETTKEIVEFMSYTAIMGSFSGITILENDKIDEISEFIQNSMKTGELLAKVVSLKENLEWLPGLYYYDLVLVLRDQDENIQILNHELVKKGLAKWISGSEVQKMSPKSIMKELNKDQEEDENWESFVGTYKKTEVTPLPSEESIESDLESLAKVSNELFGDVERQIDFDGEEMVQMMKMFKLDAYIPMLEKSKQQKLKAIKPKTDKNSEKSCKEEVINNPQRALIHSTRQPEVLWQQNSFMVIISIHLGDHHDYHLEVSKSRMIFAHFPETSSQQEPSLMVINFFGMVVPKLVSHQIRGLNLVIRLPKQFVGNLWPNLTKEEDKNPFIKYKLETMEPIEEDFEPIREEIRKNESFEQEISSEDDDELVEEDEEHDDLEDPLFDGII
ncbi:putative ATP-dependent RNA helicase TDRD12 [Culicoides brevitarsis]|uniref:putative ATP-dependent RNA helicase TDRD12 n=1 Tax=Culicoides brevitarsis TaxID=469753 RepID=UPI00307CBCD7